MFDGGLREAQSDQAKAAYDGTVASCRETVLTAFQEVEDNLVALRIMDEESEVQDEAVRTAQQVEKTTTNQYQRSGLGKLNMPLGEKTVTKKNHRWVDNWGKQ